MNKTFRYMGKRCHFLSKTKDGDCTIILYKVWLNTKQRWSYRSEEVNIMDHCIKMWDKMS